MVSTFVGERISVEGLGYMTGLGSQPSFLNFSVRRILASKVLER